MCPQPSGIVKSNPMNKTNPHFAHNYSTFDDSLSYRLYNTLRFGDLTPSFVMDGIEKDSIRLNSFDRIDSLSLKAPFKGSIRKIKESFMVPKMALLPRNWDRIYVQPSNGSDVPSDSNTVLVNFPRTFSDFFDGMLDVLYINAPDSTAGDGDIAHWLTALLRTLVVGEYVYSAGSLLHVCGYKASGTWRFVNNDIVRSYDSWFDFLLETVFTTIKRFNLIVPGNGGGSRGFYGLSSDVNTNDDRGYSPFRSALETMRENPLCFVSAGSVVYGNSNTASTVGAHIDNYKFLVNHQNIAHTWPNNITDPSDETVLNPNVLNVDRLLAYQMICHHFYSNSSIDFVYTAELYRQYVRAFIDNVRNATSSPAWDDIFNWNSLRCFYDDLSGHMLERGLYFDGQATPAIFHFTYSDLYNTVSSSPHLNRLALFAVIFSYRKSLRYGDYFVGARPRPLAPINTDVAVNNNLVSVIDITKRIQAQRFANAVMRTRSKIEEYVKGLFGDSPAPDYHNPFFLSRQAEIIFGDEVQNTGAVQVSDPNSRTANFSGNLSPHTFTFHNDDNHPCIYMQIISFDIKRAYAHSVERPFLVVDRFDMFNPDFQYIGDQPIYGIELGYYNTPLTTGYFVNNFAYTTRDMEYKQRYDQASGGFLENLPGWAMLDLDRSHPSSLVIGPDFIRSFNTELDQFFLSLTGYSLGSYFHFVCITDNNVSAKRAMAVDPQILG